jgi:uncharacterized protein YeaO (DUF488 family)
MIYTSNFASIRKFKADKTIQLSISRYTPKWLKEDDITDNIEILAPSKELLLNYKSGKVTKEEYIKIYIEGIEEIENTKKFKRLLEKLKEVNERGYDIFLLCYEKKGDFCHRHLLSDFLNKKYGFKIKEY